MKIAVISDLHLGAGGRGDRFGHEDAEFLRFLRALEADFERIVLLGDIFELCHYTLPGFFKAQFQRIALAHPAIVDRFLHHPQYTYIHGNHDLGARGFLEAPSRWVLEDRGQRILFLHGHQSDWFIRAMYPVTATMSWLGGIIEQVLGPDVARHLDNIDNLFHRIQETDAPCKFREWAFGRARLEGADIVVTGHTHKPLVAASGSELFLNSGTCSRNGFNFVSIDTRASQYEIITEFR